ncbi:MAG TPA: DUF1858 domain-containing protein [candidate division Zixibacteria bacterium]|nr:DUF1858 domain-containing protein [candidate division Zixibacteria bacterium]MDD4917672.1 DUF1858 domain-containing protein [candidate division Zixibacteria bacterium]MDM7974076.1 DUF1858 domain-containing protein [candidate division Zixibacteria bacterium]HOD65563.1 DUF1858 domain-containing protein [candidate division Zixibacteria bacterium]HOZ06673.1 DUF1858 domain-containing protein [candidate division Zixibacteria bacterium]
MAETPRPLITPQTKVGDLLDAYPELEPLLIEIALPFRKLRNPVLRRTVARVTSLAQAARVGNVSVVELVRRLRRAAGQPDFVADVSTAPAASPGSAPPFWMDPSAVIETLDARPMIDAGEQPLGAVMRALARLQAGQICEVITPFEPAPLIDKAAARGYRVWTAAPAAGEFRTYFTPE